MNAKNIINWYTRSWAQSTTSFSFYRDSQTQSLSSPILFAILSYAILAIIYSIALISGKFPDIARLLESIPQSVEESLVGETTFSWDGKTAVLEPAQTMTIALPANLQFGTATTIFALGESSINSTVLQLADSALVVQLSGEKQSLPLVDIFGTEAFTLNKEQLISKLQQTTTGLKQLLSILQFFLPAFLLINFAISRGLFVALETSLLYFVLRVYKRPKKFADLLKLTLHILVLAEVLNQWAMLVAPKAPFSMLSLAFWALLIAILLQQQKHPDSEH